MAIKTSCLWLVFCLLATGLWAENATLSLRTLQLGGGKMPDLHVKVVDANEPAKLTWLTTQPTAPIQVIHDGSLKLYRQATDPEGKVVFEIAATVKLPGSVNEVLLLVWESDGDPKYVAIKDQFLDAGFNDWMAINTSRHQVALLAGDGGKPVRVDVGASLIFRPEIKEGKGVKVLAQVVREGEVITFLSSYWPAFEGQRTLIIFYDDGEKMRARRIGDRFLSKKEVPSEE